MKFKKFTEFLDESLNEANKPLYKRGQKVEYQLTHKGGVGKYADSISKSKDIETGVIKKRSKTLSSFKYELTSGLELYQSEIIGLAESVDETIILPINELEFNDQNGNPSKISKELAKIVETGLPKKVVKQITELEPNYKELMVSPNAASKKGVGTGETEYKAIGVMFDNAKKGKLKFMTVGIRKRTSGPGTGYIAISASTDNHHSIELGPYNPGRNSVATEFYDNAPEVLGKLFQTYLVKYI